MRERYPKRAALLVHLALGLVLFTWLFGPAISRWPPSIDGLLIFIAIFFALWMVLFPFVLLVGYSTEVIRTLVSDSRENIRLR